MSGRPVSDAAGDPVQALVAAVTAGELRSGSRLISRVESGDESAHAVIRALHARGRDTPVIGITGPPGAGKSTLLDQLLARFRAAGERIAVLAVDPSSPFSGGAILGDRLRMNRHSTDAGIFIRSMAARGRLGGLAAAVGDTLIVLDAMGWDRILIETVGVGQNEIDILRFAQTVLIVQTPAAGDAVQAVKAGLLEVGDLFVVNKADAPGADRIVSALREVVEFRHGAQPAGAWLPTILKTQAASGEGIEAVVEALDAHAGHLRADPARLAARLRSQMRAQLLERAGEILRLRYQAAAARGERFESLLDELVRPPLRSAGGGAATDRATGLKAEAMSSPDKRWVRACALADFGDSRKHVCRVDGRAILLIRSGSGVLAVQNACTHLQQPLDGGRVMAGQITCPFHGACFDLRTGVALSGPAVAPLQTFEVRVEGAAILLGFAIANAGRG